MGLVVVGVDVLELCQESCRASLNHVPKASHKITNQSLKITAKHIFFNFNLYESIIYGNMLSSLKFQCCIVLQILVELLKVMGHAVAQLVEALC